MKPAFFSGILSLPVPEKKQSGHDTSPGSLGLKNKGTAITRELLLDRSPEQLPVAGNAGALPAIPDLLYAGKVPADINMSYTKFW